VGFLFLFLFLLSFFFFLYYQLYHHHLLIPTLTPFTFPPSPVLKSIAPLPNNSFCPFSPTLSPCPHLPLPTCHQTTPPTYILIPLTNQPKPLLSLTQAPSTTTEIHPNTHKDHKNQQPLTDSTTHPPYFPPPPVVPPYPNPQISIASITNVNSTNPSAYIYYH
jgi:hypothetical protein